MQVMIRKVAYVMQVTMGTTAAESMAAAGNIFLGQVSSLLLPKFLYRICCTMISNCTNKDRYFKMFNEQRARHTQCGLPTQLRWMLDDKYRF
jgi:hypothetical protein